ncbi:MAG: hypothetical protein Q8R92_20235 [Deltaproteobacteria bacterium]|nr:hypothetical protein [Deltaproteobacteria bacterium]
MARRRNVKEGGTGENPKARIERLRVQLAALKAERQVIASAPMDQASAVAALREHVQKLARQYEPAVVGNFMVGTPVLLPMFSPARELEAFIAWLCGKQLADALQDALAERYKGISLALTPAQKREQLADLDAKLLELELEEEDGIRQLENEGVDVGRRPDADIEVVLDVR